jgi:hypothetical protein
MSGIVLCDQWREADAPVTLCPSPGASIVSTRCLGGQTACLISKSLAGKEGYPRKILYRLLVRRTNEMEDGTGVLFIATLVAGMATCAKAASMKGTASHPLGARR